MSGLNVRTIQRIGSGHSGSLESLKCWFFLNFPSVRTTRVVATRIHVLSHSFGFFFCALGFFHEAALAGGLILLANACLFSLLIWQGDQYGIWYDPEEATTG